MSRSIRASTRSGRAIATTTQPGVLTIRWRVGPRVAAGLIAPGDHDAASMTGAVVQLEASLDDGAVRLWLTAGERTWVVDAGALGLNTEGRRAVVVHDGGLIHADLPGVARVTMRDGVVLYARVPAIEGLGGGQIDRLDAIITPG